MRHQCHLPMCNWQSRGVARSMLVAGSTGSRVSRCASGLVRSTHALIQSIACLHAHMMIEFSKYQPHATWSAHLLPCWTWYWVHNLGSSLYSLPNTMLNGISWDDCKPVLTPNEPQIDLQNSSDTPLVYISLKQIVGSIMWIAMYTRLEIMQPMAYLAQVCTCYVRTRFWTHSGLWSICIWPCARGLYSGEVGWLEELIWLGLRGFAFTVTRIWRWDLLMESRTVGLNINYFLKEFKQIITSISIHMNNKGAMYIASHLATN